MLDFFDEPYGPIPKSVLFFPPDRRYDRLRKPNETNKPQSCHAHKHPIPQKSIQPRARFG